MLEHWKKRCQVCTTLMCVTSYFKMWFIASTSSPHLLPFHFGSSVSVWPQGSVGEQPLIVLPSQDFPSLTSVFCCSLQGLYFALLRGWVELPEGLLAQAFLLSFLSSFTVIFHPLVSKCFSWTTSLQSTAHFRTLECNASWCWDFFGWNSSTLEICNQME